MGGEIQPLQSSQQTPSSTRVGPRHAKGSHVGKVVKIALAAIVCVVVFSAALGLAINGTLGGSLLGMAGSNAGMKVAGYVFIGFAAINVLTIAVICCCSLPAKKGVGVIVEKFGEDS